MTHKISGVIARAEMLAAMVAGLQGTVPVALAQGFAFLPLDDANLDGIVGLCTGNAVQGFEYLTPALEQVLSSWAIIGDLAYVETEYFGGIGIQGAVAYRHGALALAPCVGPIGPINRALAILGVVPALRGDAFDALGLGRFRGNEAFRRKGRTG